MLCGAFNQIYLLSHFNSLTFQGPIPSEFYPCGDLSVALVRHKENRRLCYVIAIAKISPI